MLIALATTGTEFDGDTVDTACLGGAETAFTELSRAFAQQRHDVHAFCPTARPGEYHGVHFHSFEQLPAFNAQHPFDLFICCRFPQILSFPINSKARILWCHDMPWKDFILPSPQQVDRLALLSKFQAEQYLAALPALKDRGIIFQTSNAVDGRRTTFTLGVEKTRGKVICSSRIERGAGRLLHAIFPAMLEHRPDLTLYLCSYSMAQTSLPPDIAQIDLRCREMAKALGSRVVILPALSKADLYRQIASSELMLYPTKFPEISCISAMEAAACGTPIITTNDFALKETVQHEKTGLLIDGKPGEGTYDADFASAALGMLKAGPHHPIRKHLDNRHFENGWLKVAQDFLRQAGEIAGRSLPSGKVQIAFRNDVPPDVDSKGS